jgi:hypothetical protein
MAAWRGQYTTKAKICFNSTPADSLDAVRRWV